MVHLAELDLRASMALHRREAIQPLRLGEIDISALAVLVHVG